MNKVYQMCSRCVMDTTAANIAFNELGECNYCTDFLERASSVLFKENSIRERELQAFISMIKKQGRGKKYDCIVGVSGGVDSSYSLIKAVELGLRPLAIHMDNGWNSELAQHNILNLVQKLGVDLYTHVINWEEYKALQLAFFKADVIDVELLYDNALKTPIYKNAIKYKVKYILGGQNQATEGIKMPSNWSWYKRDSKNIKDIYKKHGSNTPLRTFPFFSTIDNFYYKYFKKIKWINFIDYFSYNKNEIIEELEQKVDFKKYPYKHYESVFTRFYQGFILPQKFKVDKRKVHLSTLVISGQLSREEAINILKEVPYPDNRQLHDDIDYFLKKMSWTKEELNEYLKRPERSHLNYKSERSLDGFLKKSKTLFNSK